eukprot:6471238-Alexandrium_andersonii.AAC.2
MRPRRGLGMLLRHDKSLLGAEDGKLVAGLGELEEVGNLVLAVAAEPLVVGWEAMAADDHVGLEVALVFGDEGINALRALPEVKRPAALEPSLELGGTMPLRVALGVEAAGLACVNGGTELSIRPWRLDGPPGPKGRDDQRKGGAPPVG